MEVRLDCSTPQMVMLLLVVGLSLLEQLLCQLLMQLQCQLLSQLPMQVQQLSCAISSEASSLQLRLLLLLLLLLLNHQSNSISQILQP